MGWAVGLGLGVGWAVGRGSWAGAIDRQQRACLPAQAAATHSSAHLTPTLTLTLTLTRYANTKSLLFKALTKLRKPHVAQALQEYARDDDG